MKKEKVKSEYLVNMILETDRLYLREMNQSDFDSLCKILQDEDTMKVTNKTIINRLSVLSKNGFVVPIMVNQRIRSYKLSEFTKDHEKEIIKSIKYN